MNRVVAYPKAEWSKGGAWEHLHAQQIPGCPKTPLNEHGTWKHGWTKAHTADAWRWIYYHPEGCEHGKHWRDCEYCATRGE